MIGSTSPLAEQKKAENVRESIDNELGITTPFNCLWSETKVNENILIFTIIFLFFLRHIFISKIVRILFLVIVLLILFIE
jgi:hypothetical protein